MKHFKGRIPIWFRGDSTLLDQKKGVQRLLRNLFLKWVYKGIDKALYVGEENKKYFKAMGFKDSQLAFMPHAVDNERFAEPRQQEAMALRSELGISPDEKVILFAGKLEAKKDPELLIDAFIELNAPMVHLLIVGSGTFRERIRRKAKDNVKIHLLDFRNQSYMPVLYQACDIYCLPSKGPGETWGLAVNEAMASGRAVLVSDRVGCAADLVKPGKNGYVFRSGSDISLKENIQRMLSNDLHQPGGESKRIVEQYSFREQLNTILELVKSYLI
ncbi:MAG: glycosyltransferase family 4 protein [Sphingobacteriaceae bacterium]|nr:glycosyltransferase family 4 protein [Sphingobacteriaceae bacterium]